MVADCLRKIDVFIQSHAGKWKLVSNCIYRRARITGRSAQSWAPTCFRNRALMFRHRALNKKCCYRFTEYEYRCYHSDSRWCREFSPYFPRPYYFRYYADKSRANECRKALTGEANKHLRNTCNEVVTGAQFPRSYWIRVFVTLFSGATKHRNK